MKKVITVKRDGSMRFVYDDKLRGLLSQGQASVRRASHVEPGDPDKGLNPLLWYADMSPSAGPLLGPFDLRDQALAAEVGWLNENVLTVRQQAIAEGVGIITSQQEARE